MDFEEIKKIAKLKSTSSTESKCYINRTTLYKIFNEDIEIANRIEVIRFFMENEITGCPKLYDYIYDNGKIVGYSMQYYKKAMPFSPKSRFSFIRKKCIELIDIYLTLKNAYNLCFFDFHDENVFINHGNILLFDIDSCLKKTPEIERDTDRLLSDFVLKMIYRVCFFDYEAYFTLEEKKIIRDILYTSTNNKRIETVEELRDFTSSISKLETRKTLRKLPRNIRY